MAVTRSEGPPGRADGEAGGGDEARLSILEPQEYWSWVAGALYLLLTVDLLTTLYAAGVHGRGGEINPYIGWALGQSVPVLVAVNLLALALLVVLFYGYFELLSAAEGPWTWVLARSFEVWVGLLLSAGLFVFANNLSVIVLGESLV